MNMKATVCTEIDYRSVELNEISQAIWKNPELGFTEIKAHELLTNFLEKEGFNVAKKTPLETSFIARYGDSSGLKIGICCEYDALPGVGHACGHNLIAEAGVAAALGLKAALEKSPDIKFEIIVFGTPAEEGLGGKVFMIEKGVFDEVDFAMMSHPTPFEIPIPYWLARCQLTVVFTGKPAHASAAPWEGINALDAAIACYNNVSMLRQQVKPTTRIHCTIMEGGISGSIIPEKSKLLFYVRGLTDDEANDIRKKVTNCAQAAAIATGCTVIVEEAAPFYSSIKSNQILADLYVENAKSLGVEFNDEQMTKKLLASTDMGNVSQIKPSIHPLFRIKVEGANHTHQFTEAVGREENQLPTLNSAKSMAMTAIDVVTNVEILKRMKEEFEK